MHIAPMVERCTITRAGRVAWPIAVLLAFGSAPLVAATPDLPSSITRQLPPGYEVLSTAHVSMRRPARAFQIVALGRADENALAKSGNAPARPLIIFEQRGAAFVPVGRNDHVVLKIDEGGQCDPFLDGDGTITVRGRFFTVENGVSCGQHWTDFVTFRLTDGGGFVFDNERFESWSLNRSDAPDADALVRDAPQRVLRDRAGHVTPFAAWRSMALDPLAGRVGG